MPLQFLWREVTYNKAFIEDKKLKMEFNIVRNTEVVTAPHTTEPPSAQYIERITKPL